MSMGLNVDKKLKNKDIKIIIGDGQKNVFEVDLKTLKALAKFYNKPDADITCTHLYGCGGVFVTIKTTKPVS